MSKSIWIWLLVVWLWILWGFMFKSIIFVLVLVWLLSLVFRMGDSRWWFCWLFFIVILCGGGWLCILLILLGILECGDGLLSFMGLFFGNWKSMSILKF